MAAFIPSIENPCIPPYVFSIMWLTFRTSFFDTLMKSRNPGLYYACKNRLDNHVRLHPGGSMQQLFFRIKLF